MQKIWLRPSEYMLADKMKRDLYARIGNKVIQFAKNHKDMLTPIESKSYRRLVKKNICRRIENKTLSETLKLISSLVREPDNVFENYLFNLERIEYEIKRSNDGRELY